jgi:carboxymethylenebutenolidase
MKLENQDLSVQASDNAQIHCFLSRPEVENRERKAAIIVIHEAYGLNEQIKGVAKRFAEQGFVALAPNLYTRNADVMNEKNIESAMKPMWTLPPEKRNDETAIQELMKTMTETDRKVMSIFYMGRETMEKEMAQDLLSCVNQLKTLEYVNGEKLGVTGFCLGGGLTYQISTLYPFAASVPFYGQNPKPIEAVEKIAGPVLAFYAGEDVRINKGVPPLTEAMINYKKSFEMKLYKGANHAFFNETRPVYDKDAAADSWNKAIEFFRKHLT